MARKCLEIRKKPNGKEYAVMSKGGFIGNIAQGKIFNKRMVLYPEHYTEWTSECLRQVADKLDELGSQKEAEDER